MKTSYVTTASVQRAGGQIPMQIRLGYLKRSVPLLVFLALSPLFALLRSQDYLAVDGAVRCFAVYHRHNLFFHGNNHLLYPLNILAWDRILTVVGLEPNGPMEFISRMQVMNCLAGGGCLAIVCFLMRVVTSSWRPALAGTIGYGLSRAFLLHATNSAEPMLAVFWSFLALLLAASSFTIKSNWPIALSGVLFALAMATYQSTILLAPAAIVLIWQSRSEGRPRASLPSAQHFGLGVFAASGFTATVCIYGIAYWLSGAKGFSTMLRKFFTVGGEPRVYGGASLSKLVNTPVGMVGNLVPVLPPNYAGIRSLWVSGQRLALAWLLLVVLLFCASLAVCMIQVLRRWGTLSMPVRIALTSAAIGLLVTLIPVVFWEPTYDKLWLQPLACLSFLVVLSLDVILDHRICFVFSRILPVLLLGGVVSNLAWAVRSHFRETPYLKEAQQVAGILGKGDLVVSDYDGVSVLYGSIWAEDRQVFSFPTEATAHGIDTVFRLREAIARTQNRGGHVYFLGVLDQTQEAWNAFLWRRCGVPYSEMNLYRTHSRVRVEFRHEGSLLTLREIDQPTSVSLNRSIAFNRSAF